MSKVHLRKITTQNYRECLNLEVAENQSDLVVSNAQSLAAAKANADLMPLAIYDRAARGYELPTVPMVGFAMYEIKARVGFIKRLMIDRRYQGQGYGRATMEELIRRLKLYPEVELIATSHQRGNEVAAKLYRSLGFVDWETEETSKNPAEVFLQLPAPAQVEILQ